MFSFVDISTIKRMTEVQIDYTIEEMKRQNLLQDCFLTNADWTSIYKI